MRRRGQQIILVSSGAIALGRRQLGLPAGALPLEHKQAAAAVARRAAVGSERRRRRVGIQAPYTGRCPASRAATHGPDSGNNS